MTTYVLLSGLGRPSAAIDSPQKEPRSTELSLTNRIRRSGDTSMSKPTFSEVS